jgi:hypothetical protein
MAENKWYDIYFEKLSKFGVSNESIDALKEKYGEALKKASLGTKEDSGCAYEGSLLEIVVSKVTAYAVFINGKLDKNAQVELSTLGKVCFLAMIGMAEIIEPQGDKWRQEHMGEIYRYKDGNPAIPVTMHSIAMCTQCGITFTPEEIEAMTILDRDNDNKQVKFFKSMLSTIVKSAYELAISEAKELA